MSSNRAKKPYSRPRGSDGEWLHDKAPGAASLANANGNTTSRNPTAKLLVSNLHYELTPQDLTQIFGQIGTLVREPLIRYDRSGRSLGVAIITFESPEEAVAAKARFDGKLAKGQPMTIAFYAAPPRPRPSQASSTPTLLNRIQKPPLLDRLGGKEAKTQAPAPAAKSSAGPGPVRTRARPAPRVPKKPKTVEELDKEIDAFMKDDVAPASAVPPPPPAAADGGDAMQVD